MSFVIKEIWSFKSLISCYFSFRSSSYFVNFSLMNFMLSVISASWHSPLIWHSWFCFDKAKISFTWMSKFFRQLNKISLHSVLSKPPEKTSSFEMETSDLAETITSSLAFFAMSPSVELLLLNSRFFEKYFPISIINVQTI